MAEYLAKSEDLTAVADAIRAKGGTSEALVFPDGFVSAVESIQAGGGIAFPDGVAITQGQFTMATDTSYLAIEHGMGQAPNIGVIWTEDAPATNQVMFTAYIKAFRDSGGSKLDDYYGSYETTASAAVGTFYSSCGETIKSTTPERTALCRIDDTAMYVLVGRTVKYLTAGTTYKWMAIYIPTQEGYRG